MLIGMEHNELFSFFSTEHYISQFKYLCCVSNSLLFFWNRINGIHIKYIENCFFHNTIDMRAKRMSKKYYDINDRDFKFNIFNMLKIQKPQETEEEKYMTETN
jgi:hypothetical protein